MTTFTAHVGIGLDISLCFQSQARQEFHSLTCMWAQVMSQEPITIALANHVGIIHDMR